MEEIAPDAPTAERTVETLTALLSVVRGLGSVEPPHNPADAALRQVLDDTKMEQHKARAVLDASGPWMLHGTDLRRSIEPGLEWESDFVTMVVEAK